MPADARVQARGATLCAPGTSHTQKDAAKTMPPRLGDESSRGSRRPNPVTFVPKLYGNYTETHMCTVRTLYGNKVPWLVSGATCICESIVATRRVACSGQTLGSSPYCRWSCTNSSMNPCCCVGLVSAPGEGKIQLRFRITTT